MMMHRTVLALLLLLCVCAPLAYATSPIAALKSRVEDTGDSSEHIVVASSSLVSLNAASTTAALPVVGRVVPPCAQGAFCYTTTVAIQAPPARVLQALQGDWNAWWHGGLQSNRQSHPDGSSDFDLAPIAVAGIIKPINVHVHFQPQQTVNGVVSIPGTLGGNFVGPMGFTLYAAPDGTSLLQSTWHNMKAAGSAVLLGGKALHMHWLAEDTALKNLNNYLNNKPFISIQPTDVLHAIFG